MYVTAALSPTLGSSTVVVLGEKTRFIATLNVSDDNTHDWSVELWHGRSGEDWRAAAFAPASPVDVKVYTTSQIPGTKTLCYVLYLPNKSSEPLGFTLRFRQNVQSPWIWSKTFNNIADGQLIFRSPESVKDHLAFDGLFTEPSEGVHAKELVSQVTDVQVFDVSAPAPVKRNEWSNTTIGAPLLLQKFYALVKLNSPWMGPRQGNSPFMIDKDALLMGYLRSDGRHVAILAITSVEKTTYIRSGVGKVLLKTRNDTDSSTTHRAIIASGFEWQKTVDAAFYAARDIASPGNTQTAVISGSGQLSDVKPAWNQTWYDGLGYCTWNSLGRELTEKRILDSLQDLTDSGILISTLIIDDNWQSLDSKNRWAKWEANENFPQGLAHTIAEIRRRFSNVKHIAVWHSIIGYWEGFAPDGEIAKNYKMKTVKWHGGHDVTVVDPSDITRFYDDFYRFLSSSGVDGVKTDVQCSLTDFDDAAERREIGRSYQDAFKLASLRHFAGRVIYCMAMQPSIFFHSLLPRNGPVTLVRNSDDFFPDIPSSHLWHVFCNALNNVFTSHLNALPDWDMFQSSLPKYGGLHAAGRCISGGPIYITDSPGKHDVSLVKQMAALSIQSPARHVILRPSRVSLPLDPYVGYQQPALLKVANFSGGYAGNGLLVVFNVSESGENTDTVTLSDFQGICKDKGYSIRSHMSGKVYEAGPNHDTVLSVTLPTHGWDFFTAVPVAEFSTASGDFAVGTFGLTSSLSGVAAVLSWSAVKTDSGQIQVVATLKALGVLSFYVSDLENRKIDELLITLGSTVVPVNTVAKNAGDSNLLDVDLEKAWNKLGMEGGWSNEVTVTLYLG